MAHLTPQQQRLVDFLEQHRGNWVTYRKLMQWLWLLPFSEATTHNTKTYKNLLVQIHNCRKAGVPIESKPGGKLGLGYRIPVEDTCIAGSAGSATAGTGKPTARLAELVNWNPSDSASNITLHDDNTDV